MQMVSQQISVKSKNKSLAERGGIRDVAAEAKKVVQTGAVGQAHQAALKVR